MLESVNAAPVSNAHQQTDKSRTSAGNSCWVIIQKSDSILKTVNFFRWLPWLVHKELTTCL
jgi:hypothetical protein